MIKMSYKYLTNLFLLVCFFIFNILIINADIISINSGGSDEIIINPDRYIEGFFSCIPDTCTSLGRNCGTFTETCGLTLNCGSCSSGQTCTSGTCVTTEVGGGGGGGGGGGSGGGGTTIIQIIKEGELSINPPELSISVIENVEETREINIKNIGDKPISIVIEVIDEDLAKSLIIDNETSLEPNEEKTLELKINVNEKKLLIGKILMIYSGVVKEIPVVIGSRSENFLFDISIFLSDKFKKIFVGEKMEAQFNLIEISTNEKVDVIANYIIKDFEGNSYYEESETFFVLGEKNYVKEFPTQNLQEGKYVLGFEISYPGAFAVSSTTFSIEKEKTKFNYKTILILISVLILIVIWIIWKIKKHNRNLHIFKKKKIRKKK